MFHRVYLSTKTIKNLKKYLTNFIGYVKISLKGKSAGNWKDKSRYEKNYNYRTLFRQKWTLNDDVLHGHV